MSSSSNQNSSSVSGNWRRRFVERERERGMPKCYRCGEVSTIRTSGTAKNPGRLFHCCPNGAEGDKYHLFKWTDECMVEEIEDLKANMDVLKEDISGMKSVLTGYEKEIESLKKAVAKSEMEGKEFPLNCFKNLMVCGIGMAVFYYYFVS